MDRCVYQGCDAYFDPTIVREPGPHNDPPGTTGWCFEGWADEELPAHDHTVQAYGTCAYCGEGNAPLIEAATNANGEDVSLFAHKGNNVHGKSCLGWITAEVDATNAMESE